LATQPATVLTATDWKAFETMIDLRIKEAEADAAMDEKLRAAVLDLYAQAKAQLAGVQADATRTEAIYRSANQAPAQTLALKQAATQPTSQPTTSGADKATLADMEAQAKKMDLDLTELKKKAEAAGLSLKDLAKRQAELPTEIGKVRDDLAGLAEKSEALKASADPDPLKRARLALNTATRQGLEIHGKLLATTLSTSEAIGELARAQQDYFARQIPHLQARIATCRLWWANEGRPSRNGWSKRRGTSFARPPTRWSGSSRNTTCTSRSFAPAPTGSTPSAGAQLRSR